MTEELRQRLAGRKVVASVSGGKDSAAMSLWLTENGIPHERVFMDTGWEHPLTYEYLRGELPKAIGPITWLHPGKGARLDAPDAIEAMARAIVDADEDEIEGPEPDVALERLSPALAAARLPADSAMVSLIVRKGMFPSKRRRFCTEELKVFPMQAYLARMVAAGADVVNAVGIRRAESEARSKMTEWEWSEGFDCEVWRPLIDATTDDVIALHQRHGLRPNPLYFKGASRVGCWPCIYARKSEIKLIATMDPGRIEFLRLLERAVRDLAFARYQRRMQAWQEGGILALSPRDRQALIGEDGQPKRFQPPTWFQTPLGPGGECWPIDRVVEWSRTLHGGRVEDKQEELFARADEGCMRWGMCETSE